MTFKNLNLIPPLKHAIAKQGYTKPTPIQLKAIPDLLEGKDLIGIAQTGTGKTAAFVLPILQRMKEKYPRVIQTLILAPTRELAAQIGESFSAYGAFLKFKQVVIFGGVNQGPQINQISRGVDIIIATPGRLLDLMNQGKINLKNIEFFVLDEADRMLDMGFIHDIKKIISKLPEKRQSLFFSATMSSEVNELAKKLLKNPIHIEVAPQTTPVEKIKQYIFFVNQDSKLKLLLDLLKQKHLTKVLVFTSMKHRADKIAYFLQENGINADAIHGNKSQNARTFALKGFKNGKTKVLVATDIAARGIDIEDISHVINFDLPNESETYIHRIGRTARAGEEGNSYSFCAADERDYLRDIEKLIRIKIEVMDHEFHSEIAKNAEGAEARPVSRNNRGRSRFGNRQNNRPNNRSNNRPNRDRAHSNFKRERSDRQEHKPRNKYKTYSNNRSNRSENQSGNTRDGRRGRDNNRSKYSSRSHSSRDSKRSNFRRR